METMKVLPAVSDHGRFGTVALGYDRVSQVRQEMSTLLELTALICGCTPEQVTTPMVQQLTADLKTRLAAVTLKDPPTGTIADVQEAVDKITGGRALLLSDDRQSVALDLFALGVLLKNS